MTNVAFIDNFTATIKRMAYVIIFIGILLLSSAQIASASIYDPNEYVIQSYYYALGAFFINGIPDIRHLDTVTIPYERYSNMGLLVPDEITDALAKLFYITSDGERKFIYQFFDTEHSFIPAPHVWTESGQYEVDIYGQIGTSTTSTYLTTMEFSVELNEGPNPTCSMTATPDTVDPTNDEEAILEWNSTNATTATINQGIGDVATSGSITVSPTTTTTYTTTFTGPSGSTSCSTTINALDTEVLPLHEKAAGLARKLVNNTEAYLWGGKGWDYNLDEFTSPERILSGYTYYNPNTSSKETGVGVDCSGLITWAFNRSYDPIAGFNDNYIKYVNADGMFRDYQSDPVDETDIRPGDTLTFDWDNDGRMDHVAMYVGVSDGYDVVNASNPISGIITEKVDIYSRDSSFTGFRRIHKANHELSIKTGSPVDLEVTDPDGNVLSARDVIPSTEEYIREIPGEMYYLELTQGHDGQPEDVILSPKAKDGDYEIKIIPDENVEPGATYSLTIELNDTKIVVADKEAINTIPENGFTLKLSGGEIQSANPTIRVLLKKLHQTVSDFELGPKQKQRKRNLLSTIESAIDWYERDRLDQVNRKLTKVRKHINKHIVGDLTIKERVDVNTQIHELIQLSQS